MRKNYLLLVVLLIGTTMAYAQVKRPISKQMTTSFDAKKEIQSSTLKVTEVEVKDSKANVQAAPLQDVSIFSFSAVRPAASADLSVMYPRPAGTYIAGMTGTGGLFYPTFVGPGVKPLVYTTASNTTGTAYSWKVGTSDVSSKVDSKGYLNYGVYPGYSTTTPTLTGTYSASTATYQYGKGTTLSGQTMANQYVLYGIPAGRPLTNADYWYGGLYGRYSEGKEFGPAYSYNGVPCDGVVSRFDAPLSPITIDSVIVLAGPSTGSDLQVIPEGRSLTLELRYLTANNIISDELIASATVTQANFKQIGTNYGSLLFEFVEEEDGFIFPYSVILKDAPFVAIVKGFDSSYNIRFLLSGNADLANGNAYTMHNGQISYFQDSYGNNDCNLFFELFGIFNCFDIDEDTDVLIAPTAGGTASTTGGEDGYWAEVFSTFEIDDIYIEDIPEWCQLIYDDYYYDQYSLYMFTVQAEALPAGIPGRSGYVTLSSKNTLCTFKVVQGTPTGIDMESLSLTKVVNGDNAFQLTYTADYNDVSVYNIAGQLIGTYQLPSSGVYEIPTTSLSGGVYMLKFSGKTNQTVKVVK